MKDKLTIKFGAMADPIAKQLEDQGIESPHDFELEDRFNQAIALLNIHGILSDGETHNARKRLMKKVAKAGNWVLKHAPRQVK